MILFIIAILCALILTGYAIYRSVKLVKIPHNNIDYKKELSIIGLSAIISSIAFTLASLGIHMWINVTPKVLEGFASYAGGFFLSLSFITFICSFIIHYYRKGLDKKLDKILFWSMICGFILTLIFFFIWSDGYADYLNYPLANGISYTGLTYPGQKSDFQIAFYALVILSGALLAYFLSDHRMYQEYGQHGTLESTFLVAFPAGIIGARIGYVIGNWQDEFAGGNFLEVFNMRRGGLTIITGALFGIAFGVIWLMSRKKKYNMWLAVDMIVPTILLAQAVGRWGNFFNLEVHGFAVDEAYFSWLPKVIFNNMHYSIAHTTSGVIDKLVGQVYVPLFLIESITNVMGYFFIRYVLGKALKKYVEFGDLAFFYLVWYGLTRVFMEPLRDPSFNMGNERKQIEGYWSWIWAMAFVLVGVSAIVINHLIRRKLKQKHNSYYPKKEWKISSSISGSIFALLGIAQLTVGLYLIFTSEAGTRLAFTPFTIGLTLLFIGLSCIVFAILPFVKLFDALTLKKKEIVNE